MTFEDLRSAMRGSAVPIVSLLAIIAGFGLLRLSAVMESYVLMIFAFVIMVAGIVMIAFREKSVADDWPE